MRDSFPKKVKTVECGILNLDISSGFGTHWTAYVKDHAFVLYFDSYGNLKPPPEAIAFFQSAGPCTILYNYERLQYSNAYNCGHLCLKFLYNTSLDIQKCH